MPEKLTHKKKHMWIKKKKKEKKGMIIPSIIHPTPYFSEPKLFAILSCSNLTSRLVSDTFLLLVVSLALFKCTNIFGSAWSTTTKAAWHGPIKIIFIWFLALAEFPYWEWHFPRWRLRQADSCMCVKKTRGNLWSEASRKYIGLVLYFCSRKSCFIYSIFMLESRNSNMAKSYLGEVSRSVSLMLAMCF